MVAGAIRIVQAAQFLLDLNKYINTKLKNSNSCSVFQLNLLATQEGMKGQLMIEDFAPFGF